MRNKKLSRFLSLMLVICLVLGVFPITGMAAEAELPKRAAHDEASLNNAIAALAETGGTITLTASPIYVSKPIEISCKQPITITGGPITSNFPQIAAGESDKWDQFRRGGRQGDGSFVLTIPLEYAKISLDL